MRQADEGHSCIAATALLPMGKYPGVVLCTDFQAAPIQAGPGFRSGAWPGLEGSPGSQGHRGI